MSQKGTNRLSSEAFVRAYMEAWKAGETVRDLAQRVGMTHQATKRRISIYRKRGVNLPALRQVEYKQFDAEKLNELMKELL